jgi:hypothetical protein
MIFRGGSSNHGEDDEHYGEITSFFRFSYIGIKYLAKYLALGIKWA